MKAFSAAFTIGIEIYGKLYPMASGKEVSSLKYELPTIVGFIISM
jgi:hypothetical protein